MPRSVYNRHRKPAKVVVTYADGTVKVKRPEEFAAKRRTVSPAKWKATRLRVLKRDHYRCRDCDRHYEEEGVVLEVHHLTYERHGRERHDDLVTLCQRCHRRRHQWLMHNAQPLSHTSKTVDTSPWAQARAFVAQSV